MGYLNNSTITVDAILTKKGRELLARGQNDFKITQFALADDEIDYDLWNPAHPLGTDYYGIIIENMPLIEASADEANIMRYKLVTLPKKTVKIPVVTLSPASAVLASGAQTIIIPTTQNMANGNSNLGYTAILSNSDAALLQVVQPAAQSASPTIPRFIGDSESATSISVVGMQFRLITRNQLLADAKATLTVIGNETGGRATFNLTVKKFVLQANQSVS